jgi:hypothetical protein
MDVTETVLIFGRNGQVAQELAHLQQTSDLTLQFAGRERCDLMTTDPKGLIEAVQPIGVINASAYTAVDRAETEPDAAYRLNRDAVGEMARACAAAGRKRSPTSRRILETPSASMARARPRGRTRLRRPAEAGRFFAPPGFSVPLVRILSKPCVASPLNVPIWRSSPINMGVRPLLKISLCFVRAL